jgi:hypothetical protein
MSTPPAGAYSGIAATGDGVALVYVLDGGGA